METVARKITESFAIRRATTRDAATLVRHRAGMIRSLGGTRAADLRIHRRRYQAWLRPRLASGEVVGFLAEDSKGRVLGSGCLFFRPEHPRAGIRRTRLPYLFSMFTEPKARGQGVATAVVRSAIALARTRQYARIYLHTAPRARGIYQRLGFEPTSEMRLNLDPKPTRPASRRPSAGRGLPRKTRRPRPPRVPPGRR